MPERIQLRRTKDPRAGTSRPCYQCQTSTARQGQHGYCSPACRFLSKINKTEGCWLWAGAQHNSKGYGRVDVDGQRYVAHRFAYGLWVGALVEGMEIDHLCLNTRCVNPEHLEQVTKAEHIARTDQGAHQRRKTHCPAGHPYTDENTRLVGTSRHCRSCESPGWGLKGTRNGSSKLTEATVAEARVLRASGERVGDLAVRFGVAQSVMSRALARVTWSHVS